MQFFCIFVVKTNGLYFDQSVNRYIVPLKKSEYLYPLFIVT